MRDTPMLPTQISNREVYPNLLQDSGFLSEVRPWLEWLHQISITTRAHVDFCEQTGAHSKLFVSTVCLMKHCLACNRDADTEVCQSIPQEITLPPNYIFLQRI